MKFELGKYYKRVDSEKYLFLCGIIDSHVFGMGFIAEDYQKGKHARFSPIGQTEDHAVGYEEITKEEYMKNCFSEN